MVAASFEAGRRLAEAGPGQRLRVRTDTESSGTPTSNVLVELPGADPGRVVMAGGHLDSVTAGPGINDNASGSATLLEIARRCAGTRPAHTIRFAWWGAEELGLLGSRHYVGGLSRAERDRIALYLNLDMVGSPNFRRLVYDGDAEGVPAGSEVIERVLADQLRGQGLAVGETALGGGSDHASFAAAGIPVGGLFTGAGEPKSDQDRTAFGGDTGRRPLLPRPLRRSRQPGPRGPGPDGRRRRHRRRHLRSRPGPGRPGPLILTFHRRGPA